MSGDTRGASLPAGTGKKFLVPSSAILITQSFGIDITVGPKKRMCFVIRPLEHDHDAGVEVLPVEIIIAPAEEELGRDIADERACGRVQLDSGGLADLRLVPTGLCPNTVSQHAMASAQREE